MKSPFGLPDRKNSDNARSDQTQPTAGLGTSGQIYSYLDHPANSGYEAEYHSRPTSEMTSQFPAREERFAQANIPTRPLAANSAYQPPRPPKKNIPPVVRIGILVLMVALLGSGGWALVNTFASQPNASAPPTPVLTQQKPTPTPMATTKTTATVSPLIFGTNLELYSVNDRTLTSAKARDLLQQMHAKIIRLPMRNDGTLEPEKQAAQMIKDLGATPLVILHGDAVVNNALQQNLSLITELNRIFGNSIVYYEYGNEEDLHGIGVQKYTDSWNRVVPQLKKAARNGHFIGPVNYQYNHSYLQSFLQNANPRPDEISWHEYTCDKSWPQDTCLQHIDNWTKHIADARATMKGAVGAEIPIMITEWNYAPNPTLGDGKIGDQAFMKTWTDKAFQTLAANRIFASMIYATTHPVFPLIASNDTLTTQGSEFQSQYQSIIVQGKAPAPVNGASVADTSTQTLNATGNEKAVFTFENGVGNWVASDQSISGVSKGDVARTGQSSLKVTIQTLSKGASTSVSSTVSSPDAPSRAGQSVAAYVYPASNSVSLEAKIVVVDGNNAQLTGNTVALTPGQWNRVTLTLPSSFSGQAKQVGVQFSSPTDNVTGTDVYIDDVGWN